MWTRIAPTEEGRYWVRDTDGMEGGIRTVLSHPDGTVSYWPDKWGGYWWSEPLPPCPSFHKKVTVTYTQISPYLSPKEYDTLMEALNRCLTIGDSDFSLVSKERLVGILYAIVKTPGISKALHTAAAKMLTSAQSLEDDILFSLA